MPFLEPEYPRYVHVNPANNLVHLFFPVVGGHEISTDNTCQTDAAPNSFEQNVVGELNKYKRALERDLQLLSDEEAEGKLVCWGWNTHTIEKPLALVACQAVGGGTCTFAMSALKIGVSLATAQVDCAPCGIDA